ncbi:cysteine dioxygenase [Oxalicibacterium solurbis]|uniref:Cysteine dioxygenase n=1 Tax=Oxalicibacterium solurbis TaxID=69280 RepID=A0A8J3F5I8_9BURK|nr:cysteine dioxygenase [Oxalicibacterium solurbis]GGI55577.1 cysteine dioxygenase [Oxalicibacterium solurbis]
MELERLQRAIAGFEALLDENAAENATRNVAKSATKNAGKNGAEERAGVDADEARVLHAGSALLRELVANDDWLPPQYAQPDAQHYRQYLLHADAAERFSIVSFVWGPGQSTPVHDHTVWGLIGMLRGAERSERFVPDEAGAAMRNLGETVLRPGDVEMLSPAAGDIHRVANLYDDRVSISIHIYGADIGRIRRHVYDPATGAMREFVSGYANAREV